MKEKNKPERTGDPSDQQISKNIREQMKGEHSLQVDQSGESFREHEGASGATVYQHQQEEVEDRKGQQQQ